MKKSKNNPPSIDPPELVKDINKIFDIINTIENTDFEKIDFKALKETAESQTTYLKNKYKDLDSKE
jgi:hypothetical protein